MKQINVFYIREVYTWLFILLLFPAGGNAQASIQFTTKEATTFQPTSIAGKADSMAWVYYNQWKSSKREKDLSDANTQFLATFNQLPDSMCYDYGIMLAQTFAEDTASSKIVRDWFTRAIYVFDKKGDHLKNGNDQVKQVLERYDVILEFVQVYSRKYGECSIALEILQEYKTSLYFDYMQHKPIDKRYVKLMYDMDEEDRFLNLDCGQERDELR